MGKFSDIIGYKIHKYLRQNLNTTLYNFVNKDNDVVFLITGSGKVRIGKSVLAQQIGGYVSHITGRPFGIDNIVFSGKHLQEFAKKAPDHSVIIYDEGRAELNTSVHFTQISRVLRDFFAEAGIYNHFYIIVLPDFFEVNKKIAIHRSNALINVFLRKKVIKLNDKNAGNMLYNPGDVIIEEKRGYFEFYGEKAKKDLYINGKKDNDNYLIGKADFYGDFPNYHVIDRDAYLKKKLAFVDRDRMHSYDKKHIEQRDIILRLLYEYSELKQADLADLLRANGILFTKTEVSNILTKTPSYIKGGFVKKERLKLIKHKVLGDTE